MIAEAGSVVVIPFPFAEALATKRRPALVLSQADFNREHGLTLLAMITTARREQWAQDVPVSDLASAGLRERCFVRPRVGTVSNELIERTIGLLAETDLSRVRRTLEQLLGWDT